MYSSDCANIEWNGVTDPEPDDNAKVKRGKIRRSHPERWKRNQLKLQKLKHLKRKAIPACRCKCSSKLTVEEQEIIFNKFTNLLNYNEQNIYLRGCLQQAINKRHINKNKTPRKVFKYVVTSGKTSIDVCQNAFLAIHGIKRDRLRKKVQKFSVDVHDFRGKHDNRPKRINTETLTKVHDFLKNLPYRESHYSRSQNKLRRYLPAELSVTELLRRYTTLNPNHTISYFMFLKIFNEDFNYSFGSPRKDICVACSKFLADISSARIRANEKMVSELTTQRELHLRKAETFFDKMKHYKDKHDPTELVLCFDYQKNLPLPVTNIQDEYYLRQLWLHNFCINDVITNDATMYLYTENFALKGPNEVISCLNHYIKKHKSNDHKKLILFCDNCFSQNKNRFLFSFLDTLCSSHFFEEIFIHYPIPGHSMMPVDRCFAAIEKRRLRCEKVDTPKYYIDLINKCRRNNPFRVAFVQHSLSGNEDNTSEIVTVGDYKKFFQNKLKASIPGISQCRCVKFSKHDKPKFSTTMNSHIWTSFSLYKVGQQRQAFAENLPSAYSGPLKLKEKKLQNIKHLVQHIENEENRKFYDVLWESHEIVCNRVDEPIESDAEDYE